MTGFPIVAAQSWSVLSGGARPPVTSLIKGLRRVVSNWYTVGPLGFVVAPSRLPPRAGLLNRPIARRPITVRLRNGMTVSATPPELLGFAAAFVLEEYRIPGYDWSTARAIVDIGANIGSASLWFALQAPHARIVAVEPDRDVARRCRDNVARNRLDGRITVEHGAVGDRAGTAFVQRGRTTGTTAVAVEAMRDGDEAVQMLTLGALLERHGMPTVDVLKLDCEGAEYEILLSASPAVLARVQRIVGEVHRRDDHEPEELERHLGAAGFTTTFQPNGTEGLFLAERVTGR